ncbi:quinolinate synthase NadA [Acidaminobacter sp. JC074]|uniref:quinolinate synthase NadA n=1 Tax=Acidaminobacter sp. JC074 TaxID=2530199 RepID=UPI001F0F8EC3|nr:quinolinate synthase NadA [Acidaminobacter sp. JC074]MCH4887383.1 quinolinate synthase NadA [Acidaminobacter sp. JC074]
MEINSIVSEIKKLKREKNAVILAHNYQIPEIQDIADIVGDSLKLSEEAAKTDADIIVFCGVHFMAESAKILSPTKKVLLPAIDAGCPMADMITGEKLRAYKEENPGTTVVCYVNSSAEVKAECDVCVTSSNALKIVESLDSDKILFAPDRNLGNYINKKLPNKKMELWNGFCITHERVKPEEVAIVRNKKPGVQVVVHPECNPAVVELADFVGSTSQILAHIRNSEDKEFIVGTEMGILHTLRKENLYKKFTLLSPALICYNMKKTSLEDVLHVLKTEENEITVDEEIREKAYHSLNRMLELSKG